MSGLPSVEEVQGAARDAVHTLQAVADTASDALGDAFGDTVETVGDALEGKEREVSAGVVALVAVGLILGVLVLRSLRTSRERAEESAGKAEERPARKATKKPPAAKKASKKTAAANKA